jgi:meiotically up-regulated gene 157 (Mug157) protein
MKKLIVVLGVVAFGFCFASCKKDCKCTYKVNVPDAMLAVVPDEIKSQLSGNYVADKQTKKDCEDFKVPMPAGLVTLATATGIPEETMTEYFTYTCKSE